MFTASLLILGRRQDVCSHFYSALSISDLSHYNMAKKKKERKVSEIGIVIKLSLCADDMINFVKKNLRNL